MTTALPATAEIVHAYRHLYRAVLRAVHYSKPARFTARDQLRCAFRQGTASDFDQEKISRTVEFFKGAERENGIEHKVLKNLLTTAWWQMDRLSMKKIASQNDPILNTAYVHYQMTVAMLNESMGLCLRG